MHFTGTAFSDALMIEFAYVVERATNFRIAPGLAEKSELGEIIGIAKERRTDFQSVFDAAFAVYQCNFSTQREVDAAVRELRSVLY